MVKDLKEDDVVLVLDSKLPGGQWPLGRTIETCPGRDPMWSKYRCGTDSHTSAFTGKLGQM